MEEIKSALIFKRYVVNNYTFKEGEKINFRIKDEIKKQKDKMEVKLMVNIFENAKENSYPFEMEIHITGYFEIENDNENINFMPNAIAILYPYVRAIVSTYTASANVNPLILPTINVNAMLKNKRQEEK